MGEMNSNWLAQLSPAHAPPPPGWWPLAPGWWIGGLLAIALLIWLGLWLRSPRRRLRQAALRELRIIASTRADVSATARSVESLLRRYALAVYGVETVGKLTGSTWIEFLSSPQRGRFDTATGRSLLSAAFGTPTEDRRDHWLSAADTFIRRAPERSAVRP